MASSPWDCHSDQAPTELINNAPKGSRTVGFHLDTPPRNGREDGMRICQSRPDALRNESVWRRAKFEGIKILSIRRQFVVQKSGPRPTYQRLPPVLKSRFRHRTVTGFEVSLASLRSLFVKVTESLTAPTHPISRGLYKVICKQVNQLRENFLARLRETP